MKKNIGILLTISAMFFPLVSSAQQQTPQLVDSDPMGVSCFNVTQPIRYGMRDVVDRNDVALLQDFLITNNFLSTLAPTGFFGRATFNAVKIFQSKYNIKPTGFVGQYTLNKIKEIDCAVAANTDSNLNIPSTVDKNVVNINNLPVSSATSTITRVNTGFPPQYNSMVDSSSSTALYASGTSTTSKDMTNPFLAGTSSSFLYNTNYVPVATSSLVIPDFMKGYKYIKQ